MSQIQVSLDNPINVDALRIELKNLQAWHSGLYDVRYQGRIVSTLECGYCETCQAITSLQAALRLVNRSMYA